MFFIAIFIQLANENCGMVRSVQDLNHAIYLCILLGICAGFVQSKRHGSDLGQIWPPTSTNRDYFLSALTNGLWISIYIGTSLVILLKICIVVSIGLFSSRFVHFRTMESKITFWEATITFWAHEKWSLEGTFFFSYI